MRGLIKLASTAIWLVPFVSSSQTVRLALHQSVDSPITNIHLSSSEQDQFAVTYGSCGDSSWGNHHHVVKHSVSTRSATRLVWVIPDDAFSGGCLSAWSAESHELVGVSQPIKLDHQKGAAGNWRRWIHKRDGPVSVKMTNASGIDAYGPWFDGVMLLKAKKISEVNEVEAKKKKIGIVGGGPAGMMSALLLDSVGFHNYEILESSHRLGGRIRTVYLEGKPEDYQYQEHGPMRFPYKIQYAGTNESLEINDHKLVFQLSRHLNELNHHDPEIAIKFIEFFNTNPNIPYYQKGIRNADGSIPTTAEAAEDPRFQPASTEELEKVNTNVAKVFLSKERMQSIAKNMFNAHKKFIDEGWDNWSESAYVRMLLGADLDTADLGGFLNNPESFWTQLYEAVYFSQTKFKTVDRGLEQIARAFEPHVRDRTSFNRRVGKLDFSKHTDKVQLYWSKSQESTDLHLSEYDFALIAAPFSMVRDWRLPALPSKITRAIKNLNYANACKVSLQFRTRFWEKLPKPIHGGCGSTDIPYVGAFCYPSFKIGSAGPAVVLASYVSNDDSNRAVCLSEEAHVKRILDAMVEIHGEVAAKQYTGKHARLCWLQDENTSGSWAEPNVGQHELYIPSYFNTYNNTIFIGEHTSYTHAWIASAFESAVRGVVQLCLEYGLVDEAKTITKRWMGRWINV